MSDLSDGRLVKLLPNQKGLNVAIKDPLFLPQSVMLLRTEFLYYAVLAISKASCGSTGSLRVHDGP